MGEPHFYLLTDGKPCYPPRLLLGYHDTRDKISLYTSGENGLEGLRDALTDEVLYGFVRLDGLDPPQNILVTYVSEQVSGVRRARALVHGRAVSGQLRDFHIQVSASSPGDLSDQAIAYRLANGGSGNNTSPPTSNSSSSASASRRVPTPPTSGDPEEASGAQEGRKEGEVPASAIPKVVTEQVESAEESVLTPPPEAEKPVPTGPTPEEIERERQRERQAREEAEARRRQQERRAKAEEEERKKEALRQKMLQAQKDARDGGAVQGYLTVQGQKNYLWQRRWYTLKDKCLYLYRSDVDLEPRSTLPLGKGALVNVVDAEKEVLIANSFKVELSNGQDPWYFFADDLEGKHTAMAAIRAYQ